jgi:hypothetical protein
MIWGCYLVSEYTIYPNGARHEAARMR